MLTAVERIGNVGVGITKPHFFIADNGKVYVVKLQNNQLGLKVLANEYWGAEFGKLLGLPFPPSDIIELNEKTLWENPGTPPPAASLGRQFASEFLDNTLYLKRDNLDKALNVTEMAGVLLFDHMFHNADRTLNKKNLLLRQEDTVYKIYAIDNSHLLRSGKWSLESVNLLANKLKVYYRYTFGILLRERLSPQDFTPYLEKFLQISAAQVDTIIQEIPSEWLPLKEDREALAHFIKIRLGMAEEITEKLCRHIPKNRNESILWRCPPDY